VKKLRSVEASAVRTLVSAAISAAVQTAAR
jgi:hypothetical protein